MKVLFDTNVYVAHALSRGAATRMIERTRVARWRIAVSPHVVDELERVLRDQLAMSRRFARLAQIDAMRHGELIEPPPSRHIVPGDPADTPVLRAAVAAGVDYLVTNDAHLLALDPYEGVKIFSMAGYVDLLRERRLW